MLGLSALRIIDFSLGRSEEIFHHGDVSRLGEVHCLIKRALSGSADWSESICELSIRC